jgi:hypothetical protein
VFDPESSAVLFFLTLARYATLLLRFFCNVGGIFVDSLGNSLDC